MHRLVVLFACVASMFSLAGGSMAHAMEPPTCVELTNVAALDGDHAEGDGDQILADGEKGYPHHHGGCHGHHVATPFGDTVAFELLTHTSVAPAHANARFATYGGDPALRPPQA